MQCANCDSPITDETRFCAGCGAPLPAAQGRAVGRHSAVLADEVELAALKELHEKKRRLGDQMRAILEFTKESGASEADQQRYTELREEWTSIDADITTRMAFLMERQPVDRRKRASRGTERRRQETEIRQQDQRSGSERREELRRTDTDRRDPFPGDVPTQRMPKISDPPSES